MARSTSAAHAPSFGERIRAFFVTSGVMAAAAALCLIALALAAALLSYNEADPSFDTVTGAAPQNWMGAPGAWVANLLFQLFGLGAVLMVPVIASLGVRLARGLGIDRWRRYLLATGGAILSAAIAVGVAWPRPVTFLPSQPGGLTGLLGGWTVAWALAPLGPTAAPVIANVVVALFGLAAIGLWLWGLGVDAEDWGRLIGRVWYRTGSESAEGEDVEDQPAPRRVDAPRAVSAATAAAPTKKIVERAAAPAAAGRRAQRERQTSLDLGDAYQLPTLDLLTPPPKSGAVKIDAAALEQNARLLESVLEDFGVKGEIVEVRPGPVVTMYELEPAAGIKASRVIGLADDIARSMSAMSARVAVVPGRNVIGIELPNQRRESVSLSELIASDAFEDTSATLPLVLGKNIAGDPVVADLAPMPHLLIAGTTGSGKSVGLNAMILSLLYRLNPDQCRMIMIDPKMLELSIYDGIPHLLSPVVTEPPKAIRALKWAVEQMEDRYRMMASVGVRALSSFNQKVREAKIKGQPLGRRVQTGWDSESGQPIYEEETLDYEPLPLIVVVVDELADLMMTAGKEVEFLIQRLAQKARAAGIHLIMATQRPSVDVITGVIKANLPTRISFQVTSKIDSRTILGEQGAEQLLGKGDMLYMPGGKQIVRVHGPFVSDDEVQGITDHWRSQGAPEYISAVTEEPEDAGQFGFDLGMPGGEEDGEAALYRRAVQIVAESQKASTSYIQRQLRVGYNNAARLIERMEKDGLVGQADHVGRREVLIDTDGHPI